jgi:hypothetical protein
MARACRGRDCVVKKNLSDLILQYSLLAKSDGEECQDEGIVSCDEGSECIYHASSLGRTCSCH